MEQPKEAAARTTPNAAPKSALVGQRSGWLFSPSHFRFKLLSGTAVGVTVIIFLAGTFLFVGVRNYQQGNLRNHTIEVIRLSSLIENDLDALEGAHRGFLLTGDDTYRATFERRRDQIRKQVDDLVALIMESSPQRKRIMRVQDRVRTWLDTIGRPEMEKKNASGSGSRNASASSLGASMLEEARRNLQSIQDEEQILVTRKTLAHEWPVQSSQMLDFLPKLERSVIEMEKEKRGYLLTGDNNFSEAYKRAVTDFYTVHGYLATLVVNSTEQAALLADLRQRVENWIENSAQPDMSTKRAGRTPSRADNDRSEALMGGIRNSIANFERNELHGYEELMATAKRQRIIKTCALGLMCAFAAGLLIFSSMYTVSLGRRQLAKLEGAEVRIRAINDNILDGMIVVDHEGTIQSMNPAAERMFGCIDNEMVGRKFTKLIPKFNVNEPGAEPVTCAWENISQRTGGVILGVGHTRKQATFPVEISLSEMEVDQQKHYIAMIRDVTERKQFEKALAAEKESLAVTLGAIGDGVITTDVQGKIIMINHTGEMLTGWKSREAIGQPLKTVFDIAIDLAAQARVQKSGFRTEAQSLLLSLPDNATLRAKGGEERVIEQVASPIRDSKNEIAGVVLVFRDITERQRTEDERRKAEMLEQLGLLAGGIAHDFNNLLTAIIGNISLASLLLPPNDEMVIRLNDAKNASLRARDLAQQLLTFARGGAPIKKTASIGKLIQDTVSFSLRGSHSRSEFNFGAELWPAEIDPGQISQVIANLVVNADQAMPNGGTLHVACDNFTYEGTTEQQVADLAPGDYIRISIRDEGCGISEHYLQRIFDPYFTTKSHGNGLGLATTYSIIKNHNGLITVASQIHVGTTFTIYLPALKDRVMPSEAPSLTPASLEEQKTGGGRILIVDDEEAIRALVEFTLTRLGYEVAGAESAQQGVDLYREKLEAGERFDAVILDLTLPGGMGGKEALKKLIEIDPTVNAIVSSGYATDATMSRYQDFGFRGVIAKPYEAAELGRTVYKVIHSDEAGTVHADYPMEQAASA
jgi:two-component system, cell cycle sensor histidine kinase and response regulator CckA